MKLVRVVLGYAVVVALVSEVMLVSVPLPRAYGQRAIQENVRADGNPHDGAYGTISGRIRYIGEVPKARTPDDVGERRDLLAVDRRTRGLRYAVAYLDFQTPTSGDEKQRVADPPVRADPLPKSAVIDQKNHAFVPHLIAVVEGQSVKFTNSDLANHNIRTASLDSKNQFNVFTGTGLEYEHSFQADAKGRPILLSCDIHPWMRGWIYVFQHPYFAVSSETGEFKISSVPPGQYRLTVRQPDAGYIRARMVHVSPGSNVNLEFELGVADARP